jgi:ubiquitin C-terminal hydrolase
MRKIYRSQSPQALNPKELYNAFVKKYTYFKPYTQQDAHEFLRFLLEGLKSEVPAPAPETVVRPTMKRTRRRTLVSAGSEDIESPGTVGNAETQGTYIDQLFGGKLASYVVCDVCKSVSPVPKVLTIGIYKLRGLPGHLITNPRSRFTSPPQTGQIPRTIPPSNIQPLQFP